MSSTQGLTPEEKEHFMTHGWVKIPNAFTKEKADAITKDVWTRLGMDPNDQSTWTRLRTNMPDLAVFDAADLAPRAWAAICELCGGEDRITPGSRTWRDSLIVNLGTAENEGKPVPPQDLPEWHVDGDFFVHYLDSPEQALLVTPLFTDIVANGGATYICPEAIPKIAKHLHDHPEGVSPRMTPRGQPGYRQEGALTFFREVARSCDNFVEATGQLGDVYLMHPLMLHAPSSNALRRVRIITNPPVHLREPHNFDRADGDYSMVERFTLKALGKESLPGWKITQPRETLLPERVKNQEKMREEEVKRLEALTGVSRGEPTAQAFDPATQQWVKRHTIKV